MALLLGKSEDAKEFEALAQKVEDAINEHLWDEQNRRLLTQFMPMVVAAMFSASRRKRWFTFAMP